MFERPISPEAAFVRRHIAPSSDTPRAPVAERPLPNLQPGASAREYVGYLADDGVADARTTTPDDQISDVDIAMARRFYGAPVKKS